MRVFVRINLHMSFRYSLSLSLSLLGEFKLTTSKRQCGIANDDIHLKLAIYSG